MTHSVNIVHWNCQGFNAHGSEYIWFLSKQKHVPDIICLQETFFQNENDHPELKDTLWQTSQLEILKEEVLPYIVKPILIILLEKYTLY